MSLFVRTAAIVVGASVAAASVSALHTGEAPGPQASAILAFDHSLQRVVLVESRTATTTPGRAGVWTWDGQRWTRRDEPGPPVRSLAAGAYDLARGQLVLFGGRVGDEGVTSGDTWAWDGKTWRDVTDASAGVRNHHAMAYDERRARTVMAGGIITPPGLSARQQLAQRDTWTYSSDTWEWDGARWSRMTAVGTGGRSGTALAYDGRQVVLFGGVGADRVYASGTWSWDGRSWQQLAIESPPLRASHAMAYDSDRGLVILYGGGYSDGTRMVRFDDMWQWDGRRWTQIDLQGATPGVRIGHAMAYDRARKRLVLFGGFGTDGAPMSDTWEWDGAGWKSSPPP